MLKQGLKRDNKTRDKKYRQILEKYIENKIKLL